MPKQAPKHKSARRFEQINKLVDEVCPQLAGPSHVAVLLVCWRHAREAGHFQLSTKRIAKAIRLSERQTVRIMDDLESIGVLEMVAEHNGPIPRKYRITGKLNNGDTHVTNSGHMPPERMMTPTTANGDTHDR